MLQALIYRQLTQSTSTFLQNAVRCIELTRADEVGQRDMNQNVQTNGENTDDNVTNFSYWL